MRCKGNRIFHFSCLDTVHQIEQGKVGFDCGTRGGEAGGMEASGGIVVTLVFHLTVEGNAA